jgi:hypothetical protein
MRALKLLVIVMGVLLIAGIVALGFGVQYRLNHPRPVAVAPGLGGPGVPSAALPNTIDLPAGAHVVGAEASGDRLVVRVELAAGAGEELIIVNLATGAPVSTVMLKPQTATPSGTP